MSFATAATARRIGHALPPTSVSSEAAAVFQPHPLLCAQVLAAFDFDSASTDIVSRISLNNTDDGFDEAPASNLPVSPKSPTATDAFSTIANSNGPKRVTFNDVPEVCSIPSCFDLDDPNFDHFQSCRFNFDRVKAEGREYRSAMIQVLRYWKHSSRIHMLSKKKQRILKLKAPNLHLKLPEYDDVDRFNQSCKADRDFWMELQERNAAANRSTNDAEPIGEEAEEENVELEVAAFSDSNEVEPSGVEVEDVAVDFGGDNLEVVVESVNAAANRSTNDAEPSGEEAEEENVELEVAAFNDSNEVELTSDEVEDAIVDFGGGAPEEEVEEEEVVAVRRPMKPRMLKELECTLDGVYWRSDGRRTRRASSRS